MRDFAAGAAKRLFLEILGWTVLAIGVLALFLPGPGLLLTFSGLAVLSTQYTWARRVMEPVRIKATKRPRITPLKAFKDAVAKTSLAPKLARGVWPPAPASTSTAKSTAKKATKASSSRTSKKAASKKATSKGPAAKRPATKKASTARKTAKKSTAKR